MAIDEMGRAIGAALIGGTGASVALVSDPPGLPTSIRFLSPTEARALAQSLNEAADAAYALLRDTERE